MDGLDLQDRAGDKLRFEHGHHRRGRDCLDRLMLRTHAPRPPRRTSNGALAYWHSGEVLPWYVGSDRLEEQPTCPAPT
jgi:hypothetical protein